MGCAKRYDGRALWIASLCCVDRIGAKFRALRNVSELAGLICPRRTIVMLTTASTASIRTGANRESAPIGLLGVFSFCGASWRSNLSIEGLAAGKYLGRRDGRSPSPGPTNGLPFPIFRTFCLHCF